MRTPTFCRICEAHCGLVAEVEGERVVRMRPDRDHPVSRGYSCIKGLSLGAVHHDRQRLDHPLKRVDGRLERVGWDQATGEIGARVRELRKRHGPRAIALYRGNPSYFSFQHLLYATAFIDALGSPNLFTSVSIDSSPKLFVAEQMYGHALIQPVPDLDRCELFLCLGSNPMVSQMSIVALPNALGRLQAVVARGGRVVSLDPRRTETAERVGEHRFIRPGTDAFLLMAMLHVVAHEHPVDRARIERHADGLDALLAAAAPWTPERVAPLTGVDAATIRELAEAYRRAHGAFIYVSTGVTMGPFGSIACWLVQALSLLAGHLDAPGGALVPEGAFDLVGLSQRLEGRAPPPRTLVRELLPVAGAFPVASLAEEIETDHDERIRALFVTGGNPLHSVPGRALSRAFDRLELSVCIDLYPSETAQRADYVLPAADLLEHSDFPLAWMLLQETPYAQYTDAVVAPKGERRPEWRIFSDLAIACGAPALGTTLCNLPPRLNRLLSHLPGAPQLTPDHVLAALLRLGGKVSLRELREQPSGVLLAPNAPGSFLGQRVATPDRRIRLGPAPLLADLARLDAGARELGRQREGLVLIGKRERRTHNSWMHNVERIAQPAGNTAVMHPDDAAARGLGDGDVARIESGEGAIELPVRLSDELMPGVLAVPHGWGHRDSGVPRARALPGENFNHIAPSGAIEPISGQAIILGHPVRVSRRDDTATALETGAEKALPGRDRDP